MTTMMVCNRVADVRSMSSSFWMWFFLVVLSLHLLVKKNKRLENRSIMRDPDLIS